MIKFVDREKEIRSLMKNMLAKGFTLKNSKTDNWETLFKILCDKVIDEKLLLIIDEFQYIGKFNPAFPSAFQKIWDTVLKEKT
jgi:uncharacterized protein